MPRRLLVSVLVLLGLSVGVILALGMSPVGSALTNLLQIVCCGLAAAMCFAASRRGRGLSRSFWVLVGCSIATWGVANLGWMYYENWLHAPVPRFSAVRILFDVQGVFYAIALFQDKEEDAPGYYAETVLDSVQIAIVFLSLFFALFYVQVLEGAEGQYNELIVTWIFNGINLTLTVLAVMQMVGAKTKRIRSLYGGLALFLLLYTLGSALAESPWANQLVFTGSWYDLGWTFPFLFAALWAGSWREKEEAAPPRPAQPTTLRELAVKNVMLALAPLIVLVLVARLGPQWRMIGFSLLAISIVSYVLRLGVTEFRQTQSSAAVMRHRVAMESTVDGMSILDSNGEHVYANSAFARMVGLPSAQAVIGKGWRQVYDPRDIALLEDSVRETVQKTGGWSGQVALHRGDQTTLPVEMTITAMAQGGTVCVARDISDRLRAEHARAEAEIKYRTLVEQVAAISYIAELGITGRWYYVSPQIESILGYTADEWLANSTDWMRNVHTEDHHIIHEAERSCNRGEPFQAEYRLKRKDGQTIWVSDTAVVVRGSDSHQVMEGLIVDITERKLLENQLQQSRRMEAVGRLAGGIAHDFNNLLTIINGYAEMALRRTSISPELKADIQQINNASERASVLVRQLLAFSRKQVLQPKSLDLNAIVEGLNKLLNRLMGADIEMITRCGANIGTVKADPSQIEQVIMNLVVNARDAMSSGGRLTIETSNVDLDANYARDHATVKPGPYVMLAVSDTGIGMDQETQAHIFEPFYTTKGGSRGTGLGLSTVYGIVKQSGGYIWVYSEPGKGTTIKVYLPRVEEPVTKSADTKPDAKQFHADQKGTETILLVEDEEAVRDLARSILADQGYAVLVAGSAAAAEELAAKSSREIHLLLTDVVMPGLSGRELARRVTASHPRTRVLFMSGYTDNVIASGGVLEAGVAFLQKPFTPRALTQKVREVLDRHVATR
jgi:PAS domain S-box-containing protein